MRKRFYGALILLLLGACQVTGQTSVATASSSPTSVSSTNTPAPPPPVAITLAKVVSEADSATAKLHEIESSLETDSTLARTDEILPRITREIDQYQADDARLLSGGSSLAALRTELRAWHTLEGELKAPQSALVDRITLLDGQLKQLDEWSRIWQATLVSAQASAAPPDILQRIQDVQTAIGQTAKTAQALRAQTLSAQGRVAEQGARVQDALTAIQKAQASAVSLLFTRDSDPLWSLNFHPSPGEASVGQDSLADQIQALSVYGQDMWSTLVFHFFGFVLLAATLVWLRYEVKARMKDDPALQHASAVFDVPISMAALLALLIGGWLYPLAPRLFLAGIEAAALIPTVVVLRRLITPTLFPVLYAMVFFYTFDQIRHVETSPESLSRSLFIFELVAGTLFLAWLIRSHHWVSTQAQPDSKEWVVKTFAHAALVLLTVSGLANVLGYVHLSILLGTATFSSSYLAIILYAAVRIGDAVTLSILQIRPFLRLGLVQRHHTMLVQGIFRIIHWTAGLSWLVATLELFSLRAPLWAIGTSVLTFELGWGSHVLTPGDVLAFGLTVWASFLISKAIRFALEEEVYPHLQLPAGIPYTASTLVHYLVLILGFFAALEFLGVHLSNFVVLAGAFGVGLGFGLQNIMNNFVSGIILLFERPIKVGDIIQVDTAIGTVERIGIRASVISVMDGSEIIVPNGNLISGQVTNWTFSNRRRMLSIPITLVSKTDPPHAMGLLVKIAQDHPLVLKEPPPQALATSLTATALTLDLRVWTNSPGQSSQIRSDLSVAINAALAKENIAMG